MNKVITMNAKMNSVGSNRFVSLLCVLFLIGQMVFVDQIYAQRPMPVRGIVLDGKTKKSIPNATIKLSRNKITIADMDGKFKFSCLREDTLVVTALGYCPRLLSVHDLLTDSTKCNVLMQPLVQQLRSVQVVGEKKKSGILKALIFLDDLSHPFTYFSRDQKNKRRFKKLKANSVYLSENVYWQINRQCIAEISKLTGEDLDKCITYCNKHIALSPDDDERSITNKLLLLISDYFKKTKSDN